MLVPKRESRDRPLGKNDSMLLEKCVSQLEKSEKPSSRLSDSEQYDCIYTVVLLTLEIVDLPSVQTAMRKAVETKSKSLSAYLAHSAKRNKEQIN